MRVCPDCGLIYQHPSFTHCSVHNIELIEQMTDPLVGSALDRYTVTSLVGGGSMGRVYRAHHAGLDRVVAIKVLYGDYASGGSVRARFEREAQATARIQHPNVVSVTDFGRAGERYFLVMEYLEGRTLAELIAQRAPLSPQRASKITLQLAHGLGAAHELGFVHRDLKPANIYAGNNEDSVIKILDFGLVSMMSMTGSDRITRAGHVIGTPMYMAPEQTTSPSVTPSADLYSLGVIIYEMLTGRPPFLKEGRMSTMLAHLQESPPPLLTDGGLERLCLQLLEKRPEDRPRSATGIVQRIEEMEEELALLNEPTLVEHSVSSLDPAEKAARTDPELFALNTFAPLQSESSPAVDVWSQAVPPAPKEAPRPTDTLDPDVVAALTEAPTKIGNAPDVPETRLVEPVHDVPQRRAVLVEADAGRAADIAALLDDRFDVLVAPTPEAASAVKGADVYLMTSLPKPQVPAGRPSRVWPILSAVLGLALALVLGWSLLIPKPAKTTIPLNVSITRSSKMLEVVIRHPGYSEWRHAVAGGGAGRTEVSATLVRDPGSGSGR